MAKIALPKTGVPAFHFISTANRIILGNNITEYVYDYLIASTLMEIQEDSCLFNFRLYRHEAKGTALIHYFNDELCDIYSDMNIVIGYDGTVKDISNYDSVKNKWKDKQHDILKKYSSDIKVMVEGTSLLLEDKKKFIASLFGGYGFWRFFIQERYHKQYTETEQSKLSLKRYFGEIDLPLNVESTILAQQDNDSIVQRIDNKATLDSKIFDRKGFARMLKNLTKIYNLDVSLDVDFEETYHFMRDGTLNRAEMFLNTSVSNWYAVSTGHKLSRLNEKEMEILTETENMAEAFEST